MEFFKGTGVAPADDNEGKFQKHNNKKALVCAFLLASIDRKLNPLLINCTNAKEMWDKLESLYGATNEDAKTSAWKDFYAYKMKNGIALSIQIDTKNLSKL